MSTSRSSSHTAKQELATQLRPVFDLLWSPEEVDNAQTQPDTDTLEDLWLDFFMSRDIQGLHELEMFDAVHFQILEGVYEKYPVPRLSIFDTKSGANVDVICKVSKICFFLHEIGVEEFLEISRRDCNEKWDDIHSEINETNFPLDARSQKYFKARSRLAFLFSRANPAKMLGFPEERQDWFDEYGQEALELLQDNKVLAGEPCHLGTTFYPLCYFAWSGFSGGVLKQVHGLFPMVMSYTQEQGNILQFLSGAFYNGFWHSLPIFRDLLDLDPLMDNDGHEDFKVSLLEILFRYYQHALTGILLTVHERAIYMETIPNSSREKACAIFRHRQTSECLDYIADVLSDLPGLSRLEIHQPSATWTPVISKIVSHSSCLESFSLHVASSLHSIHGNTVINDNEIYHDNTELLVELLKYAKLKSLCWFGDFKVISQCFKFKVQVDAICEALKKNQTLETLIIRNTSLEGRNISGSFLQAIREPDNTALLKMEIYNDSSVLYFKHCTWSWNKNETLCAYENYANAEDMRTLTALNRGSLGQLRSSNFSPCSVIMALKKVEAEYHAEIDQDFFCDLCEVVSDEDYYIGDLYMFLRTRIGTLRNAYTKSWCHYPEIRTTCLGVSFGILRQASSMWDVEHNNVQALEATAPPRCFKRKRDETI